MNFQSIALPLSYLNNKKLPMSKGGIEPPTHGFSVHRSTTELLEQNFKKYSYL
jgi:hypothetical protein